MHARKFLHGLHVRWCYFGTCCRETEFYSGGCQRFTISQSSSRLAGDASSSSVLLRAVSGTPGQPDSMASASA